jgi:hypothetical protein
LLKSSALYIFLSLLIGIIQTSTPKQCSFKITKLILKDIPKPRTPKLAAKSVSYSVSPYTSPSRSVAKSQKQSPDLSLQPDLINSTSVPPANNSQNFHDKKMERNKCIEDFREYLEETLTARYPIASLKSNIPSQNEISAIPAVKAIPTAPTKFAFKSRSKENLLIVPPKLSKLPNSRNQSATTTTEKQKPLNISNAQKRISLESRTTTTTVKKVVEKSVKKEKSYDPKIAQDFIKQQQEKRKIIASKPTVTLQRDLIKERLADLRKNTLKIVSNNVKKSNIVKPNLQNESMKGPAKRTPVVAQQRPKSLPISRKSSTHTLKVDEQVPVKNVQLSSTTNLKAENGASAVKRFPISRQLSSHSLKEDIENQPMVVTDNEIHKMQQLLLDLEQNIVHKVSSPQPKPNNREEVEETKTSALNEVPSKPLSMKSNKKYSAHLITPDIIQKMGIRRKPDSLGMETPMSPLKLHRKPNTLEMVEPMPANEVLDESIPHREFSFNNDKDLDLKIPNVKLQSPALEQHSKSTNQNQTFDQQRRPNVPYWLQQTSMQPYPYNFITAVRKKLQAIVNAENKKDNKGVQTSDVIKVQGRRSVHRSKDAAPHNLYQETPRVSKTAISQKRKLNIKDWSTQHDSQLMKSPTNGERTSKSLSEVNTNMSSISMPVSEVNTISEISSIKSDAQQRKSYSSSFPSNSETSPENAEHVPLISPSKTQDPEEKQLQRKSSTFVLNGSKIMTDSPFDWQQKKANVTIVNQTVEKLDGCQQTSIVENFGPQMSNDPATLYNKEQEYKQLLATFNKSLSQVVEVHQVSDILHDFLFVFTFYL